MKTGYYLGLGVALTLAANGLAAESKLAWHFEYGDRDLVVRTIDPANRVTGFAYEGPTNGPFRSVTMTPPEGKKVSWRFDDFGRLARMIDGEGTTEYGYDGHSRLKSAGRTGGPLVGLDYDLSDRVTQLRVGDFYRVEYEHDFLGRLIKMKTPAGEVRYEYWTGQGTVVRILPNGVKTFWKRDGNGELLEITHGFFKKPGDKQYSILGEFAYKHGANGRITEVQERGMQGKFSRQYRYDQMGRLTDATGQAGREFHCNYDPLGNRISATVSGRPEQVFTHDWAGRLTAMDGQPCQYDACGNLAEATIGGTARQYGYHPDGRLAEMRAGNETVQYRYDGSGRLVVRKNAQGETRFVPDPLSNDWQPLVIEEAGGKRTLVIWDGAMPLALVRNGEVEWLLHDHLGSVRLATDGKGEVTRQCDYDPFGQWIEAKGGVTLTTGFAGLFWDEAACAYLTAARAFSPVFGGFMQPDPVKSVPTEGTQVSSLYAYCGSDPVNWVDRDGAERSAAEIRQEMSDWQSAMREQQSRMRAQQSEMRERLSRMRWEQREMMERLRGVGARQLAQVVHDRNEYVGRVYPLTLASMHYRVIGEALGNLPVGTVGFLGKGLAGAATGLGKGLMPSEIAENQGRGQSFKQCVENAKNIVDGVKTVRAYFGGGVDGAVSSLGNAGIGRGMKMLAEHVSTPLTTLATKSMRGHAPSPVGGVYLGGAGGTIDGLGNVKGVRLDDNGNLVLIGESGGDIKLPPLRVDDVVTVFRSVYLNGEGPTVTIDPNPKDPEKLPMVIVHSEATKDTYVGWVLYEADRLMKGYTLGKDNITKKEIESRVEGYSKVLDTMYFGAEPSRKEPAGAGAGNLWINYGNRVPTDKEAGGTWERFWIVPAEANRFEGPQKELSLFDVPLKVKTQKMKWEKKELVDDLKGKSSPGANAFTAWFTRNYDAIAAEQYLMPPPETGMSEPVPVFAELRRIALMTAIAEKLRDQGEPLPFWMRDYEVQKVTFEHETPGMEVAKEKEAGNMVRMARIYGGVELSPESKAVKVYGSSAEVAKTAPERRVEVNRGIKLARDLEKVVAEAPRTEAAKPFAVQRVTSSGGDYQTVAVPSATTVALDPCQMDEDDIAAALPGGREIRLTRSFNSFFDPKGEWGRGWTMNLPKLQAVRIAKSREDGKVLYATCYELLTPLNSVYARFKEVRPVAKLDGAKLQVPDQECMFYGLGDGHPKFLQNTPTLVLLLKDGKEWHFAESGELIAIQDGPQLTVYKRRSDGRVTQVAGMLGGTLRARIDLEYNHQGTLAKATAVTLDEGETKAQEVTYGYGDSGRLAEVGLSEGTKSYEYKGTWVANVSFSQKGASGGPEILRSIEYNARGQVVSDKSGDANITHAVVVVAGGLESTVSDDRAGTKASTRYDLRMRPVEEIGTDGNRTQWVYPQGGGTEMTVKKADNRTVKVVDSADGRERIIAEEGSTPITAHFDEGGRLTRVLEEGKPVLTQEWRSDGQLARTVSGTQGATFQYGQEKMLRSILLHPANAGEKVVDWQETKVDGHGRPVEISDCNGLAVSLKYDDSGALTSTTEKTADGVRSYSVKRGAGGQVQSVNTSWGDMECSYDEAGAIRRVIRTRGNQAATTDFKQGRVSLTTDFDGGQTAFDYAVDGAEKGKLERLTYPNGLGLEYAYDGGGRLATVSMGTESRIRLNYDVKGRMAEFALEPRTN